MNFLMAKSPLIYLLVLLSCHEITDDLGMAANVPFDASSALDSAPLSRADAHFRQPEDGGFVDEDTISSMNPAPIDATQTAPVDAALAIPDDVGAVFDAHLVAMEMSMPEKDATSFMDQSMVVHTDMDEGTVEMTDAQRMCPERMGVDECLFGRTTTLLRENPNLQVVLYASHSSVETLSALRQSQLVYGFQCEGIFTPTSAQDALDLIDFSELEILRVSVLRSDDVFEWFRFYMGDTEVGFIFVASTLDIVGFVGDQDINRCQRSR